MLTIRTDRANRQVDVIFAGGDRPDLIDDLHDNILPSVPGASQLRNVRDSVVAIQSFDDIVQALADAYRARGEIVEITAVE
ncbi:hypothetical protein ACFCVM_14765 [Agromyces sp. NPDC056389]|uniref:hypothetical protein n=1 Tax=Agromyces sp. NPDC056389 TaxID=3345805 RepID=UPI0035D9F723